MTARRAPAGVGVGRAAGAAEPAGATPGDPGDSARSWPCLRQRAVRAVDARRGCALASSPDPRGHREDYDREIAALLARARDGDYGLLVCEHDDRIHGLGGGIVVCFACFVRGVTGGRSAVRRVG